MERGRVMENGTGDIESLLWLTVIGIMVYVVWSVIRTRRWMRQGRCTRCGAVQPTKAMNTAPFCERCAVKTVRNHRLAFNFFLGLGIVCVVLMTIGILGDIRDGATINWKNILQMYGTVLGSVVSLVLLCWGERKPSELPADGEHPNS